VLLEKRQFPWATRKNLKRKLDVRQQARYDVVRRMGSDVLPNDFIYFNHVPHKWGHEKRKIGGLIFNNVKER
jgi:hypothetical protein